MISRIVRQRLNVSCILALTATATRQTEDTIRELLEIPQEGVIRVPSIRSNLQISVSNDTDATKGLIKLLNTTLAEAKSIIVYVTFKVEVTTFHFPFEMFNLSLAVYSGSTG